MAQYGSFIGSWIWNTPDRALQRAYVISQEARSVHTDLMRAHSLGTLSKGSGESVTLYLEAVCEQWVSKLSWSLLEFQVSRCLLRMLSFGHISKAQKGLMETTAVIYTDRLNPDTQRRLAWIEAAQADLIGWKRSRRSCTSTNALFGWRSKSSSHLSLKRESSLETSWDPNVWSPLEANPTNATSARGQAYESVGLVPRSITRTLSRFGTELGRQPTSLVLPAFRLARYQAVASLQYMVCLVLVPWIAATLCDWLWVGPLVQHWWNTAQPQVFLSASQEEKALRRLQEAEQLLWLDMVLADPPPGLMGETSTLVKHSRNLPPSERLGRSANLAAQIHQRTIQLVDTYNCDSVQTILHLCADAISLMTLLGLLTVGKKRLAVLNSWAQELFYSLSDTMKAFFILLCTDLCIGFHSPHGWEVLVSVGLEHLGCAHNKHVISCFVSTFPVILDTVFKYWIFRHLNRISPSIVVSYHTMNE